MGGNRTMQWDPTGTPIAPRWYYFHIQSHKSGCAEACCRSSKQQWQQMIGMTWIEMGITTNNKWWDAMADNSRQQLMWNNGNPTQGPGMTTNNGDGRWQWTEKGALGPGDPSTRCRPYPYLHLPQFTSHERTSTFHLSCKRDIVRQWTLPFTLCVRGELLANDNMNCFWSPTFALASVWGASPCEPNIEQLLATVQQGLLNWGVW